jgi:hypothetical protein
MSIRLFRREDTNARYLAYDRNEHLRVAYSILLVPHKLL